MERVWDKGEVPSGREDTFSIAGIPRTADTDNSVSCLIAISYNLECEPGSNPLPAVLPAYWEGQYVTHFSKVSDEVAEAYEITHLALLEGPPEKGVKFTKRVYFAQGVLISGPFIMLGFDQNTQTYKHLHCYDCCMGIAEWFMESQPIWKAKHEADPRFNSAAQSTTRH